MYHCQKWRIIAEDTRVTDRRHRPLDPVYIEPFSGAVTLFFLSRTIAYSTSIHFVELTPLVNSFRIVFSVCVLNPAEAIQVRGQLSTQTDSPRFRRNHPVNRSLRQAKISSKSKSSLFFLFPRRFLFFEFYP
jgi:hypothetical protein